MNQMQMEKLLSEHDTPMYLFDIGTLKARVAYLRSRLPEGVTICYAMKANTFVVKELCGCMDRFEVCSPGEYEICRTLGVPSDKLVISGVNKTPSMIEGMVRANTAINAYTVESPAQFRLLRDTAHKAGARIRVFLRLTSGNQFGLDEAELREIIHNRAEYNWLDIAGLQYYSGTQKQSLKRLSREMTALDAFMRSLREEEGFVTRELEFGPGFPVFYFQNEEFDEEAFLQGFSDLLRGLEEKPAVTLELGRSVAASCGTYFTKVVDTKVNSRENYAILDGGIHQLVYFGQTMAMRQPVFELFPPRENAETENWNLCGSLCTVNDMLVKQLPVPALRAGDVFAFHNTGAYCITEGISLFLSRELPEVVLLTEDGRFVTVRKSFDTEKLNTPVYEKENSYNG